MCALQLFVLRPNSIPDLVVIYFIHFHYSIFKLFFSLLKLLASSPPIQHITSPHCIFANSPCE